jgi:hypothetical protein
VLLCGSGQVARLNDVIRKETERKEKGQKKGKHNKHMCADKTKKRKSIIVCE